jgi:hypothetical protein
VSVHCHDLPTIPLKICQPESSTRS